MGQLEAALFVTCVADLFYPQALKSMTRILRRCGVTLTVPAGQTCCGQAAYNAGYRSEATELAAKWVRDFQGQPYVIAASGSCATMVKLHFPELLAGTPLAAEARRLADRTYEFSQFLVRVLGVEDLGARLPGTAAYHHSCHMQRLLGVKEEPLQLLRRVRDLQLTDWPEATECCGFGGTFAVKWAELSVAMADEKLAHLLSHPPRWLVGSDLACLTHMGGRLHRLGSPIEVLHVAQVIDMGLAAAEAGPTLKGVYEVETC